MRSKLFMMTAAATLLGSSLVFADPLVIDGPAKAAPQVVKTERPISTDIPEVETPQRARHRSPGRTSFSAREIKRMQIHLMKTGYFEGPAHSRWSKRSIRALREWQAAQGLPATGLMNEQSYAYASQ